jgi:hypothetical protein
MFFLFKNNCNASQRIKTMLFFTMISANVSGRGTPNISGRDTPPSPAGSVEAPVHQLQQQNIQPIQSKIKIKLALQF